MGELSVFNHVSLDGFFTDADSDMSWAHRQDKEFDAWVVDNAQNGEGIMLFGRKTYDQMASFWPTPMAAKMMPEVAKAMNEREKIVFSKKLKKATWQNTRIVNDPIAEVKKLKKKSDLVIMGSGQIVSLLTKAGLVDTFTIVVNPIILGAGRTLFETVDDRLSLKLKTSRTFKNGNVVLVYG